MRRMLILMALLAPALTGAQTTSKPENLTFNLQASDAALADTFAVYTPAAAHPDKRVGRLDLNDTDPAQALKLLFNQAGENYVIEGELGSAKLTLHADNIKFSTALDLITQTAGVKYAIEMKDGKRLYKIGKNVKSSSSWFTSPATGLTLSNPADGFWRTTDKNGRMLYQYDLKSGANTLTKPLTQRNGLRDFVISGRSPSLYTALTYEDRSTFTCPHCKGQVTVMRKRQEPKCPKCQRVFQSDWQYCPVDGAKRPQSAGAWKFCPICGKEVQESK